jgi:outer membrane receptor protein involved in Fe transport
VVLALWPQVAPGQAAYGSLAGQVLDPAGVPVGSAVITVTSLERSTVETTVATDGRGSYLCERLLPGLYTVKAARGGFRTAVVPLVRIGVDGRTTIDLRLELGPVYEQVTVVSETQYLVKDRADVATRFEGEELRRLPNLDRNFTRSLLLTPGAQLQRWQHAPSENPQGSLQIMLNGQPFSGTAYLLDGVDNRENILGLIVINPTLESVAETKITAQNFSAEFGQAIAGVVSVQTRSGTNELHGSALGTWQDGRFQARNPFTQPPDRPVPRSTKGTFGTSLAGPLRRNRWFYFADYQATRNVVAGSRLLTVPTRRAREGDLGEYGVAIYDPSTGPPEARQPFPGNTIPRERLSPVALALLTLVPLPTREGLTDNYQASASEPFNGDAFNVRLDGTLGQRTNVFARYSFAHFSREGPAAFGAGGGPAFVSLGGTAIGRNQSLALGLDHAWKTSTLVDFRLGFYRYNVDVHQFDFGTSPAEALGLPGLNLGTDSSGLPALRLLGPYGFVFGSGSATDCNCPLREDERQLQWVGNLTHVLGRHQLKTGFDVRRASNLRVPSDVNRSGEFFFSPSRTRGPGGGGLALATFLLGDVSAFGRFASSSTSAHEHQSRLAAYLQDTWHVRKRLTVDLGLRLDMVRPQSVDAPGNGGWLDLRTGEVRVAGVGGIGLDGDVQTTNHWGPRLGLAWELDERTVLHAGYGRSVDVGVDGTNFGETPTQNPPVLLSQDLNPSQDYERVFGLGDLPPRPVFPAIPANGRIPLADGIAARALPERIRLPVVDAYTIGLQRQLGKSTVADLAYVGNRGSHTYASADPTLNLNEPTVDGFPQRPQAERRPFFNGPIGGVGASFGWTQDILYFCGCASTSYDSLQAKLQVHSGSGSTLLAHYTVQRVREDARSYFFFGRGLQRGRPDWDRTHSLVVAGTAEIPRRFPVLRGWQIGGVATLQSGYPFEVTYRGADADRDTGPNRPDLVGDPAPGRGDGLRRPYFNATPIGSPGAAFARPAEAFGNLPRNALTGPGYGRVDASLSKQVRLRRRIKAELRLDVVNLFNHVNLDVPDGEIGVPGNPNPMAGFITSTAYAGADPQRTLQLGLRVQF